jgi:hypothetical protein
MLVHENQRQRWRDLLATVDRPELSHAYGAALEGPITPIEA